MKAAEYTSIVQATSSSLVRAAAALSSQRRPPAAAACRAAGRAPARSAGPCPSPGTSGPPRGNCRSRSSAQTRRTSSTSNGPRRAAIASAVRPTTSRSPDAGTGTRVLPKSSVIAAIPGRPAGSAVKPALVVQPFSRDLDGGRVPVDEEPSPPEALGRDAGRAAARVRVEHEVARPARRSDDPLEQAHGLLGRVARPFLRSRRDDRHPPDVGGQLAARRLLRSDEPGREVRIRSIASRSNVHASPFAYHRIESCLRGHRSRARPP